MKKFSLIISLFLVCVCARGQDISQIKDVFSNNPELKNAQYSIYAKYADGPNIIAVNPDARLTPASVLKLYVSAAAFDILGTDYSFDTRLYYGGVKRGSRVDGVLYIKGGGDPTLGSLRMPQTPGLDDLTDGWVIAVKSAGINKINGDICADNTIFKGMMLPWHTSYQNIGNYFAAPVDGLSVRDNAYEIYFEPSSVDGAQAKILKTVPDMKGFTIRSYVTYSKDTSSDQAYVSFVPAKNEIEIRGTLPLSTQPARILAAMPSPGFFLAQYFKDKLEKSGVVVKGQAKLCAPDTYDGKTLILIHKSPKLSDIVRYMDKRSFNLYADTILRMLAVANGKDGESGKGIEQIKTFLAKLNIDTSDFDVYDASGISRDDVITCSETVNLLQAVLKQPYKDAFMNALPIVGNPRDNGTMAHHLLTSNAANNALVKTGSLDRVRAHAGYVKDINGKMIVFCVISNNFSGGIKDVDASHEAFIDALSNIGLKTKPVRKKPVVKKKYGDRLILITYEKPRPPKRRTRITYGPLKQNKPAKKSEARPMKMVQRVTETSSENNVVKKRAGTKNVSRKASADTEKMVQSATEISSKKAAAQQRAVAKNIRQQAAARKIAARNQARKNNSKPKQQRKKMLK